MNQSLQEKVKTGKKNVFLCCWHFWSTSGPSSSSKVKFQSSPTQGWVSVPAANRRHTRREWLRRVEQRESVRPYGQGEGIPYRTEKHPSASLKEQLGQQVPETLLEDRKIKTIFTIIPRYFCLLTLILSQVHNRIFQRLHDLKWIHCSYSSWSRHG